MSRFGCEGEEMKFLYSSAVLLLFTLLSCSRPAPQGELLLSEFLAVNAAGLDDEDGEAHGWLELYNPGASALDLAGYYLTDEPGALKKWTFPSMQLEPKGFVVVFASAKDRSVAGAELHTNFKIAGDGGYLALVAPDGSTVLSEFGSKALPPQLKDVSYGLKQMGSSAKAVLFDSGAECRVLVPADDSVDSSWTGLEFDDSKWSNAATGIGYDKEDTYRELFGKGGQLGEKLRKVNTSVYIRIPFEVADAAAVAKLTLKMKYDDGFIAFLNGERVALSNAEEDASWDSAAKHARLDGYAADFENFKLKGAVSLQRDGSNVLAIHGMNYHSDSSDMLVLPELHAVLRTDPELGSAGYTVKYRLNIPNISSKISRSFTNVKYFRC